MKLRRNKTMRPIQGFTLIEIMLALFIFAILAIMAASGLYAVVKSRNITAKHVNNLLTLQIAMVVLGRDITQMIDRPILDKRGKRLPSLLLKDNVIEFTRAGLVNPLAQAKRSTLLRVKYYVKKQKLIRQTWPVLDRAPDTKPSQKTLLPNVTNFKVLLLDNKNQTHHSWPITMTAQNLQLLPKGVEITLTLKNMGTINRVFVIPGVGLVKLYQ